MSSNRSRSAQPTEELSKALLPVERIEQRILVLRGERVLLDRDLAELYQVEFVFRLTSDEWQILRSQSATSSLRSQTVISKPGRGGRRYAPFAFTEHGAVMAATVLNSPRAVAMSLLVVRAFVRLRGVLAAHDELAAKLAELERRYDRKFEVVFQAIREIIAPPGGPQDRRRIGFSSRA